MHRFSRIIVSRLVVAGLCAVVPGLSQTSSQAWAQVSASQVSVRSVKVLGSKDAVEIEVEASARIVPQTRVLSGPDRLVVDFPNAVPSNELRSQSVDRGEVKDLRVGLFQSKPPVTRVVLDLKTAQSYQIFPSGHTVIIKVMGGAGEASAQVDNFPAQPAKRPSLVVANFTTRVEPVHVEQSPQPLLEVTFRGGLLGIRANKATLSEVLFAVQQRTGAQVDIAAGAEQEQVVADIAPAPAPEVLARLLNGSKFNFLILSGATDPQRLDHVILTPRPEAAFIPQPTVVRPQNDDPEEAEPVANQQPNRVPPPGQGPEQPEVKLPPDANSTPDQ
jgi:antitoxin (DNA-binding transcriptional repressor) of toxin-antitoxin stability system